MAAGSLGIYWRFYDLESWWLVGVILVYHLTIMSE